MLNLFFNTKEILRGHQTVNVILRMSKVSLVNYGKTRKVV